MPSSLQTFRVGWSSTPTVTSRAATPTRTCVSQLGQGVARLRRMRRLKTTVGHARFTIAIIVSVATAINRRISSDLGLVASKALQALAMELRIGDRAALLTHTRLAERRVCLEQPVVLFALRHVALWRPGWRNITRVDLWAVGYQLGPSRWRGIPALRGIGGWWGAVVAWCVAIGGRSTLLDGEILTAIHI